MLMNALAAYDVGPPAALSTDKAAQRGAQMRPDDPAAAPPVEKAIARLEDVLDQETTALRARGAIDLKSFNNRKSHGLLDLSRALRVYEGTEPDALLRARLSGLRQKLEENRRVLKIHLDAVRENAAVIADAIREAESDGTYTAGIRSEAPRT